MSGPPRLHAATACSKEGLDGEPFLSEIRMMSFNFPPRAGRSATASSCRSIRIRRSLRCWDGLRRERADDFALPNLRGAYPSISGRVSTLGETAGNRAYDHAAADAAASTSRSARPPTHHEHERSGRRLLGTSGNNIYAGRELSSRARPSGSHLRRRIQAHNNMMPYLALNFCVALRASSPRKTRDHGHDPTLRWRDQDVRREFAPGGLDVLPRPTMPISENRRCSI